MGYMQMLHHPKLLLHSGSHGIASSYIGKSYYVFEFEFIAEVLFSYIAGNFEFIFYYEFE